MRAAAWCLVAVLTWGFSLTAYGRAQRISGFPDWDLCNAQMEHMREQHPDRQVKDCDLDADLAVRPKAVIPSPRPGDKGGVR